MPYREDDFDLYNLPFRIDLDKGFDIVYKPGDGINECMVIKTPYAPKQYTTTTCISRDHKTFLLTFLVHKNVWSGGFVPSYRRSMFGENRSYYVL